MITQIIWKRFFCVTDVRAIGKLIPRQSCVSLASSQKVPYESAQLHKIIPAREPCVTDVLCNWVINSQTIKCVCVCKMILGPIVVRISGSLLFS